MTSRQMAQRLGRRGGRRRAQRLSAEERQRIASLGGKARSLSLQLAQRIDDNLQYAALTAELRRPTRAVIRLTTFEGPLPGIYPARAPSAALQDGGRVADVGKR
jgi:hypothetical protein